MTQKREKLNSLVLSKTNFWMSVSIFSLFRTYGKIEHFDENDFRQCYGNFFEIVVLKVTW